MKKILMLLVLCVMASRAYAVTNCVANSGLPSTITYPGTVAVSSTLGYGDTIPGTQRPFTVSGTCKLGVGSPQTIQVGSRIVMCTRDSGSTEISTGIYSTGVTGIGMRVRDSAGNTITNATSQACMSQISTIGSGGAYSFSGTLELVRTSGTIASGSNLTPAATQWAFGVYNTNIILNNDNGGVSGSTISMSGSIAFRPLTCAVSAPGTVMMNKGRWSALTLPGSVNGATPFTVSVKCNDNALVGMTLDAAPGYSVNNAPDGIITIKPRLDGAQGFGLQILRGDGATMPFQSRVGMGSITADVPAAYGFIVQYKRIGSPALPGIVESAMILTMDYQ